MEVLDTITLKDIKFDHQVASMSHGGRTEKIVAAELGNFTMFYIYSKVGKVRPCYCLICLICLCWRGTRGLIDTVLYVRCFWSQMKLNPQWPDVFKKIGRNVCTNWNVLSKIQMIWKVSKTSWKNITPSWLTCSNLVVVLKLVKNHLTFKSMALWNLTTCCSNTKRWIGHDFYRDQFHFEKRKE